jgi:hypothetical protein
MSEWFKKLTAKNTDTCIFCKKPVDKKTVYTITMDTAQGPHQVKSCEPCAKEFDEVMKDLEEVINARNQSF